MDGNPGVAGYGDLVAIQRIFGLADEEFDAVEEAFFRDVRAQKEARRRERSAAE